MKFGRLLNVFFISGIFLSLLSFSIFQVPTSLPDVSVKNLNGEIVSTSSLENDSKPYLVILWATWNRPSVLQLETLHSSYESWQKETGCKIVAISVDDARNTGKVQPFVKGKGWLYEVYLDPNMLFKNAMVAEKIPTTYIINAKNEIVWTKEDFAPGDEEVIYENLKKQK